MLNKLHDATFLGIMISEHDPKQIALRFKSIELKICEIILHGVKHFRCNNFLEGNIILDAVFAERGVPNKGEIAWMLEQYNDPQYVEKIIEKINSNEFVLLSIDSSYGARIVAVAKSIETKF